MPRSPARATRRPSRSPASTRVVVPEITPKKFFGHGLPGVDLEKLERELLQQAIRQAKGNKTRAGRLLGLNRDQIRYRMEKYGLDKTDAPPTGEAPEGSP